MSNQDRKEIKLGDITSYVNRGIPPKYSDEGIFIINQKCIRDNTISFDEARFHDKSKKIMQEKIIQKYDILINSTGVGTLGRLAQYKKIINKNVTVDSHVSIVRPFNNQDVSSEFVGYSLINQQSKIENLGRGATGQTELSRDDIKDLDLLLPPFPTQQAIASILSKYEDLIENNNQRIKILEQEAELIYKEWFVKFKFSGHEDVKMVDSGTEFELIPEGWSIGKIIDLIRISKGKNITKDTVTEGSIPVVAGGLNPSCYHNKANTKGPVITISASGANAGYVNLYYQDVWASDCSYVDLNTTPYVYYYYLLFRAKQTEISGLQVGSAQPHVYPKDLMGLKTINIPEEILKSFTKLITPIFLDISNLQKQNENLKETRDILLPKLINGEVEV